MSLVEVVVSITILAIILASLGAVSFQLARQSYAVGNGTYINAAIQRELNRLAAVPYDSLALRADSGTRTFSTPPFAYTREIRIADSAAFKRVTLVITPANGVLRPDTEMLDRTQTKPSPFNTP